MSVAVAACSPASPGGAPAAPGSVAATASTSAAQSAPQAPSQTASQTASTSPAASSSPSTARPITVAYGTDASQVADLYLPAGTGVVPVVVVIHGGYWQKDYGNSLGAPLAEQLATEGVAAWNIEYRRVGNGGGWPTTLEDVAAAIDALAGKGQAAAGGRLDLAHVVTLGHSAGGMLAVWAAARPQLPKGAPGAGPKVLVTGAVAQAGVLDLRTGAADGLGGGAVQSLLGGEPKQFPARYAVADPSLLVPLRVPVTLVHGTSDDVVPMDQSESYVGAARKAGDHPKLIRIDGADHFALINPDKPAGRASLDAALALTRTS